MTSCPKYEARTGGTANGCCPDEERRTLAESGYQCQTEFMHAARRSSRAWRTVLDELLTASHAKLGRSIRLVACDSLLHCLIKIARMERGYVLALLALISGCLAWAGVVFAVGRLRLR